ncbi:hypothetical protein ACA910_014876 [Epithemia clementina (nom. ined.)]
MANQVNCDEESPGWQGPPISTGGTETLAAPCTTTTTTKKMDELLSDNLLVLVLLTVGDPKDIHAASLVSKRFHHVANLEELWKELAVRRYGIRITETSAALYGNDYKQMVTDDNIRGAMPCRFGLWKSAWINNTGRPGDPFYCCLITGMKLDRMRQKLLIYLDARGSGDLRLPETSGIWIRNLSDYRERLQSILPRKLPPRPNADGSYNMHIIVNVNHNVTSLKFVSLLSSSSPQISGGRFKGYLEVDQSLFSRAGSYLFCYANAIPNYLCDYGECTLFTLAEGGQTLMDIFTKFCFADETPFDSDSPKLENERWEPHLSSTSISYNNEGKDNEQPSSRNLNRLGPWPECVGMTGEECANYIKSQNPHLSVQIFQADMGMNLYYCDSEVRFWVDKGGIVRSPPRRG